MSNKITAVGTIKRYALNVPKKEVFLTVFIGVFFIIALAFAMYVLHAEYVSSEQTETIHEIKDDVQHLDITERQYYYRHGEYADNSRVLIEDFPEAVPARSKHPSYMLTVKVSDHKHDMLVVATPLKNGALLAKYCGTLTDNSYGHLHSYGGKVNCW